jgi:hypothetical protein
MYAVHTDKESPHAHVTVKMQGANGKKIKAKKSELYKWRESLAEEMRAQGFKVTATSRQSRGLVGKSLPLGSGIKFKMHNKPLDQSKERKFDKENIQQLDEKYKKMGQLLSKSKDKSTANTGKKILEFNLSLKKEKTKLIEK